jgi:hypothetical protein
VIDQLADTGLPVKICCRILEVSAPVYYKYKTRPMAPTQMRRVWLTALIREVHIASRGTYRFPPRSWANALLAWACKSVELLVSVLMTINKIAGLVRTWKSENAFVASSQ